MGIVQILKGLNLSTTAENRISSLRISFEGAKLVKRCQKDNATAKDMLLTSCQFCSNPLIYSNGRDIDREGVIKNKSS